MDTEWKEKWLTALRSGKYEQGQNYLRQKFKDGSSYCCLGVLADIQECYENDLDPRDMDDELLSEEFSCGIDEETQRKLTSKNDAGVSFKEIADYIEREL